MVENHKSVNEELNEKVIEQQLTYWEQELVDIPQLITLPTDRPRPAEETYRGAVVEFIIPKYLVENISKLSENNNATIFMTFLAAFQILLYRYTQLDDIIVGTPIAHRQEVEIEDLIGFFVNTLVIRGRLGKNLNFIEFLQQIRETTLQAYAHQDVPFEQLVEHLKVTRSLSYHTIFQVMFSLNKIEKLKPELSLNKLEAKIIENKTITSKFDLSLDISESSSEGLIGSFEYNIALFDENTIKRMVDCFLHLLTNIIDDPERAISTIPLLSYKEEKKIIFNWNNTNVPYPQDKSIVQVFEEQVLSSPDNIALEFQNKTLTYNELNQRANQLARHLINMGIKRGSHVAIYLEPSHLRIIALLAILKAQAAYIPLDSHYPRERILYVLQETHASLLITQKSFYDELIAIYDKVLCIEDDAIFFAENNLNNLNLNITKNDLAYIIFTSGSTGKPKGVQIPHQGIVRLIKNTDYITLSTTDKMLQVTSISFDVASGEIWCALLTGATLVIAPQEILLNLEEFVQFIRESEVTHLMLSTRFFDQIAIEYPSAFSGNKSLYIAGEAFNPKSAQNLLKDKLNAPLRLVNSYGPTENSVYSTTFNIEYSDSIKSNIPIGKPIANSTAYILNNCFQPQPIGVPGELYTGGDGLARGYHNRPDITAERFLPNPFSKIAGERLYRTGDLCRYLPDGNIEYIGRIDNQIKLRGFRIELGEIEVCLTKHPAVLQAAVLLRESSLEIKQLLAYFTLKSEYQDSQQEPIIRELKEYLGRELPDYMVPTIFLQLERFPLTSSRKIDRKALPAPSDLEQTTKYEAPETATEKKLAKIWEEVLHIEKISRHDNFFNIGGDSILSMIIISKCRQSGIYLTSSDILKYQTIYQLAMTPQTPNKLIVEQGFLTGSVPLTTSQMEFFQFNFKNVHHYNAYIFLSINENWNMSILKKSLEYLTIHHDSLRMRFKNENDHWEQYYSTSTEVDLSYYNLEHLDPNEQSKTIFNLASRMQCSLDITQGPLFKTAWFRLGDNIPSRLLFISHHLIMDEYSWSIFLEDLYHIYHQNENNLKLELPLKTSSYRQRASYLLNYANSQEVVKDAQYWLALLDKDLPSPPFEKIKNNKVRDVRSINRILTRQETHFAINSLTRYFEATLNDILLTVLTLSFQKWNKKPGIWLEFWSHGRDPIISNMDFSRTLGWFNYTYPCYLEISESNIGYNKAIKSIMNQLKSIPNDGIGFGLLKYLRSEKSISNKLNKLPPYFILFNHYGRTFDNILRECQLSIAEEPVGLVMPLSELDDNDVMITVNILNGKLEIEWGYCNIGYKDENIREWTNIFMDIFKKLINERENS